MDINDIEVKRDNEIKKLIIERLGIQENETLRAEEINAILEALRRKPTDPIWIGDPLDEYLTFRNQ